MMKKVQSLREVESVGIWLKPLAYLLWQGSMWLNSKT